MIARLHAGHAFADLDDDARAFVSQHGRKHPFRVITAQGEGVGMADAGVGDADQHLSLFRRGDVDLDDFKRLARGKGHGGTGFHDGSPFNKLARGGHRAFMARIEPKFKPIRP